MTETRETVSDRDRADQVMSNIGVLLCADDPDDWKDAELGNGVRDAIQAALTAARREGMEEAAKIARGRQRQWKLPQVRAWFADARGNEARHIADAIEREAAAIRAKAGE